VGRIRAGTAEQGREVGRKYLQDGMLAGVELGPMPVGAGAGGRRGGAEGGGHAR